MDTDPGKNLKKITIHPNSFSHISFFFFFFHAELYSELCTIEVDLSHLSHTSNVQTINKLGGVYYKVAYELVMLFGGTEIEAQLCWKENVCFYQNCIEEGLTLSSKFYIF